jgi:hypothetical protein
MKTENLKVRGTWIDVVDGCRNTVSKPPLGKEPGTEFKKRILLSEHSPIRSLMVRWSWLGIKSWIATHWSRHKWECYIATQRTDRTGVNRDKLPQDNPVNFVGEANAQQLIDTWRKRLCRQASAETRAYAEDFNAALQELEPEVADVLVPNCVYRCGCPEMVKCGWYTMLCREDPRCMSTDIQARYDAYNRIFNQLREAKSHEE